MTAGVAHGQGMFVEENVTAVETFSGGGAFGWAVSELRDINGDGAMELIAGAPSANRAWVYSGADGQLLFELGPEDGGRFGHAIGDAGDVNGDGVVDILVGANSAPGGGAAYVLSGADGTRLHKFAGEALGDFMGHAVAWIGDIDADGFGDVLVSARANDENGSNAGKIYVYSGQTGGLIRSHLGEEAFDQLGAGVTGLRADIDGDGVFDYAAAASAGGSTNRGAAYVFSGASGDLIFKTDNDVAGGSYGQFFIGGPGDVDNDGTADLYVGQFGANGGGRAYVYSGVDGHLIHELFGSPGDAGVGCGRGAGDVNGDGYADLAVGHYTSRAGGELNAGRIVVHSGKDGSVLRKITSRTAGEQLGFDTVGVGDVTGDGIPDLLCSAASGGRVYLVAGVETCPADLNGDGVTGADDFSLLITQWGIGWTDLTGDGNTDFDDFAFLINAWNCSVAIP